MSNIIFYFLFACFVLASLLFIVLGIYGLDFLLITVAVLFAIAAVLILLENRQNLQNLQNPFTR